MALKKKYQLDLQKKFGNHIFKLRQKKKWTLKELADKMEKDMQAIHRIEAGKTNPTLKTMKELAIAFDIKFVVIASFEEE